MIAHLRVAAVGTIVRRPGVRHGAVRVSAATCHAWQVGSAAAAAVAAAAASAAALTRASSLDADKRGAARGRLLAGAQPLGHRRRGAVRLGLRAPDAAACCVRDYYSRQRRVRVSNGVLTRRAIRDGPRIGFGSGAGISSWSHLVAGR